MGCKSSTNQQEKTVNTNSLFFKIGGEITIKQMVDKLYEFNLEDPSIKHFFAETKHEKLKVHLVDFLGKTFGGPDNCRGLNLVEGHSHINISDKHFDCFLENLGKSFKGIQQINETQGREILFRVELLRYWIVENSKIEQPLYIKLGGSEGIEQAVHIFYKRVLSDKEISGFFKNTDMLRQEQQQFSYLSMAFGGPNDYNGKNVFDAHKGMNIKEEHFDRVVMHLTEALRDMGVVQIIIEQVAEICYNLKGDIMRAQKVQEQPKKVEQKQEKPQQKQEEKNQSLYQQIGGKEAVEVAVKQFYQKVLADELVSPFFKNTDMVKQESQQIKFLTMALGGPSEYEGKDMYEAHKGMNIEEVHFDKIVELLAKTLTELGVKQEQLGKIAEICASVKGDIVEKKEDKNQSLYQQIGGKEAVELAVKQFYEKVLADELVSPFFKNTDMVKQESQQIKFLTMALGGPSEYEGKDMYEAHKGMNIEEVHFDKIVELLAKTLTELGVKQEQLGQIADICASVKGDIVEKKEEKQEEKQEEGTGQEQKSLYDRLGGQGAMEQAVKIFYEKMLADDSVNHFFKNTDMEVQSKQQLHFLSMAFGGPQDYNGRDMYTAHKGLNIQDEHYSTTVGHLASTLKDLGVSDELISEVAEVANSVKSDIVGV